MGVDCSGVASEVMPLHIARVCVGVIVMRRWGVNRDGQWARSLGGAECREYALQRRWWLCGFAETWQVGESERVAQAKVCGHFCYFQYFMVFEERDQRLEEGQRVIDGKAGVKPRRPQCGSCGIERMLVEVAKAKRPNADIVRACRA